MSIPAPRYVWQSRYEHSTDAYGTVTRDRTIGIQAWKVHSSGGAFSRTGFVYHGKTQLLNGELFVEGEVVPGDAVHKSGFRAWRGADRSRKHATFEQYQLAIRNQGWRNPTPYSASVVVGDCNSFQGSWQRISKLYPLNVETVTGELLYGSYGLDDISAPTFNGDLENRAVIKALSKLKAQKINLANAFAEREQTVGLAISTLKRLTFAARSLRKGNLKGVAEALKPKGLKKISGRHLRRIANAAKKGGFHQQWLELQYGWKPLLQDVYGAVSALHAADRREEHRYAVTVIGSVKEPFADLYKVIVNSADLGVRWTESTVGAKGCKVRLDYFLENPFTSTLTSLGITNPAETLWEVTPESFVVDWFLPIGQYLTCLDAATGYKFRAGTRTLWSKSKVQRFMSPKQGNPYWTQNYAFGQGQADSMTMNRSVYSASPLPRVPSFKNPFPKHNAAHMQNAIALFGAALGGHKVPRRGSG